MAKKVLIISTSLRNHSNSEILAHETERGAKDAGNDVEFLSLKGKNIQFCKGCFACQKLGKCVIKDDANAITEKMKNAEVIVWATPIYFYEMSGQMKTMIDRASSLYTSNHNFHEVYLITTSESDEKDVIQTVMHGVNGWMRCLNNVHLKGFVEAGGVNEPKEVSTRRDYMEQAYNMGKNI